MEKDNNSNFDELKLQVEALLFSYGDYLSIKDIMQTLLVDSELLVNNAIEELVKKYSQGFSFHIEKNQDSKIRMALKDDYSSLVTEMISGTEIPQKVLKVLGVIAYEQPVTKTRLHEIMGKSVKQEVDYLYRNQFLSYEKHGIGKYYRVTKKFYDYFKLDEDEDFKSQADKSITTFLEEPIKKDELQEKKIEGKNISNTQNLSDLKNSEN